MPNNRDEREIIENLLESAESAIALGDHGKVVWGAVTFTASGQIEAFGLGQSAVSGRIVADTQATAGDFTTGIATVPASI